MIRDPHNLPDAVLQGRLEPLSQLVERVMERSAAQRKPPTNNAAKLCIPVKSVEIHAAGD